jgi:hypothetical protein
MRRLAAVNLMRSFLLAITFSIVLIVRLLPEDDYTA